MQELRLGFFVAILLMAIPGCNKGKDDGAIKGQTCQNYTPTNAGKYLCPEGYFCKYDNEKDALDANKTGACAPMAQYKECMTTVPCDSQFAPKCETANETAYCDSLKTTKRCFCDKPGPFTPVEGNDEGDMKTPTTTK